MRNTRLLLFLVLLACAMLAPSPAFARCDSSPDLSALVDKFEATNTSPADALLRLGESHNLCLGIEYVDTQVLTEMRDFHVQNLPLREAIKSILGQERSLTIRVENGVIEIAKDASGTETQDIFDYILPTFEVRRAPLQEINTALYMQFVSDLNPQITGFAGHYPPGDLDDQVGPFSERGRSVRYLLDRLVTESKGGAWIARVPWKHKGDLTIPERRFAWAVLEYGVPKTGYASLLNSIAAELKSNSSD